MNLAKFISLLDQQALYLPSAVRVDDPFEGSLPSFNVRNRRAAYATVPDEHVDLILAQIPPLYRSARAWTYLSCWTLASHESMAMWRQYVGSSGVAIESTVRRLADAVAEAQPPVYIAPVRYLDYENQWLPEGNTLFPYIHKRIEFEYEREVRAIVQQLPLVDGVYREDAPVPRGIEVPVDVGRLIAAVRLAPDSPAWFARVVESVLDKFGVAVGVGRSRLSAEPSF